MVLLTIINGAELIEVRTENAAEARRELMRRAKGMSIVGNGERGCLKYGRAIRASYWIEEE
jgi:hypothetical protein